MHAAGGAVNLKPGCRAASMENGGPGRFGKVPQTTQRRHVHSLEA